MAKSKPVVAGIKKGACVTEPQIRVDPMGLARASIEGAVTDEQQRPLVNARVCASGQSHDLDPELFRELRCASTDEAGRHKPDRLHPATYTIGAPGKPSTHLWVPWRLWVFEHRMGGAAGAGGQFSGR
jgi:hypothetical protein